jgi:hypothetical protein
MNKLVLPQYLDEAECSDSSSRSIENPEDKETWAQRKSRQAKSWKKDIPRTIMSYTAMSQTVPGSSMIREVMWQYKDMANGGDGGPMGFEEEGKSTCRDINYPGCPDEFFQEVCDLLQWDR